MANRILKESICTSMEIDALSWFEEVFFYRLIVNADDYGNYPADPVLLAHILFPRKKDVSQKAVEEALKHMEKLRLIRRYEADGKGMYLHLVTWEKHQRIRNSRPKFPIPGPEPDEATKEKTEPETKTDEKVPETENPDEVPHILTSPTVLSLPLIDGSEYPVTEAEVQEYAALYPAVDIDQELRNMRGWCLNNEKKRKTRAGIRRFINNWLARAQDRGGTIAAPQAKSSYSPNPYLAMVYGVGGSVE